ncbi:MAG: hypothetical protein ACTSV2_12515 [Candidatus Thorarchaeota archaeon]
MEVNGRVVNLEISEHLGIKYGMIEIETESGERTELKYTRNSKGDIPTVGCFVSIEYVREVVPRISSIAILSYHEKGKDIRVPTKPPTVGDKVQITWPEACIGCGTLEVSHLNYYSHTWDSGRTISGYLSKFSVEIQKTHYYSGSPSTSKETRAETRFDTAIYLCNRCKQESQNQRKAPLALWAIIFGALITTILYMAPDISYLFGLGGLYSLGFFDLLILPVIFFFLLTIPFTLFYGNYMLFKKPFLKYVGIKREELGVHAVPRLVFGNQAYFEVMLETNPKLMIEHDQDCKGSTDLGDGFAIGFILFVILLPILFVILL